MRRQRVQLHLGLDILLATFNDLCFLVRVLELLQLGKNVLGLIILGLSMTASAMWAIVSRAITTVLTMRSANVHRPAD